MPERGTGVPPSGAWPPAVSAASVVKSTETSWPGPVPQSLTVTRPVGAGRPAEAPPSARSITEPPFCAWALMTTQALAREALAPGYHGHTVRSGSRASRASCITAAV